VFTEQHADDLAEIKASLQASLERMRTVEERVERLGGEPPLLAFVHIPKTAGGTVKAMLRQAYGRRALDDAGNWLTDPDASARRLARAPEGWERWQRRGGRATIGHVPYGLYLRHLPASARYMTFLREPVDRVLSQYHSNARVRSLAPIEEVVAGRVPEVSNLATRFLCGDPDPSGTLPATALQAAKVNLRAFAFVGIQERFEESIVLLRRSLGVGWVPYLDVHVTTDRPRVDDVSAEERALILEHNRLDAELYEFALALLEKRLAAAPEGFEADVAQLRAWIAHEAVETTRIAHEWLDREVPVGTTRASDEVFAGAHAAGVPEWALRHAIRSLKRERDETGRSLLTRIAEAPRWAPPGR
jgi:hypothetical protein